MCPLALRQTFSYLFFEDSDRPVVNSRFIMIFVIFFSCLLQGMFYLVKASKFMKDTEKNI